MRDFMDRRVYPEDFKDNLDNNKLLDEFDSIDQTLESYKFVNKLMSHYNNLEMENEKLKRSLVQTEELKNKYLKLFQSNPLAYIRIKENGTIIGANNSAITMLGLNHDNIIGCNFTEFISPNYHDTYKNTLIKAFKSIKSQNCTVKIYDYHENIIHTDITMLPIPDDDGNLKEFTVALIDISHYKNVENELVLKYQDLKEKMEVRTDELLKANESLKNKITKQQISDKKLRASEKREQTRSEEFARVLDAVPAAVWISHDNKGVWITGNQLSYEYLNIPPGANASKSLPPGKRPESFKILKDGIELEADQMPVQLSSAGHEIRNFEFDFVYTDNRIRHMMGNATPLYDENGKPRGSVSAFIDVTKNKDAEIKMGELVKELARSNKDLEQFAYVTSHDLKEPLRMVSSFTQLLEKRYKGQLDKDADEFIKFIVDGAQRMQQLLDDLLEYARITEVKEYEMVSLNEVVEESINNLKVAIEESYAVITIDTLPSIVANRTLMVQLFQNLIANAIKFQSEKTPKIHISSKKKNNKYYISVKDNGIGINPKYQKKIFKVFKRLHTMEEYDGTGIGLSITQKIVAHHNGNIWVKSEPGEGSTFSFSIPIKNLNKKKEY
jgi:PAS domain S-box-containing protein